MTIYEMSEQSLLEQLIEESGELIQAAAKRLRILRGESPTPVTLDDNSTNLNEEASDVSLLINVLSVKGVLIPEQMSANAVLKLKRWKQRLDDKEN